MDTGIKAIPTFYKGVYFRSRLEARWAVIFDRLGIDWRYETEGYDITIDDGLTIRYLPDFLLLGGSGFFPDALWVEVKGNMMPEDALKIKAFSEHYPIYVVGEIPKDIVNFNNIQIQTSEEVPYYNLLTVTGDYVSAIIGASENGGWSLYSEPFKKEIEGVPPGLIDMDIAKTRQAYAIARAAHFEYQ